MMRLCKNVGEAHSGGAGPGSARTQSLLWAPAWCVFKEGGDRVTRREVTVEWMVQAPGPGHTTSDGTYSKYLGKLREG